MPCPIPALKSAVCVVLSETMLSELALSFVVVRLSHPIKSYYASVHNLDLDALLSSSPYKEAYRREMVALAESQMKKDPHVFARQALENSLAQFGCCSPASTPDVILVSDARRPSDMDFLPRYVDELTAFSFESLRRSRCVLPEDGNTPSRLMMQPLSADSMLFPIGTAVWKTICPVMDI
ncbi:putative phosphomevalonate kinase [Clonorchis sinensis]|uniref:Phosphomevalonate kinase n=1 Tax=Clonorchis sinensis TaxID=79923 RepID=A0A8T1MZ06_CLOSI|nr:putative phosphomevalonate kinase [Clonorchis sinensis]